MQDIWDCFEKIIKLTDAFIPEQAFLIAVPFIAFVSYIKVFRSNS